MNETRLEELLKKSELETITQKEVLELLKFINSSVVALKETLKKTPK
ncbi:MAG: hypothetical protein M3Q34_01650 [bacterium]|nr:hypothetical protein [bacterium]